VLETVFFFRFAFSAEVSRVGESGGKLTRNYYYCKLETTFLFTIFSVDHKFINNFHCGYFFFVLFLFCFLFMMSTILLSYTQNTCVCIRHSYYCFKRIRTFCLKPYRFFIIIIINVIILCFF